MRLFVLSRRSIVSLPALISLLFACGADSPDPPEPPEPPDDTDAFTQGDWHPNVSLRQVGTEWKERVQRVVALPSGVAVLRQSKLTASDLQGVSSVETFDAEGHRVATSTAAATTVIMDLVAHTSGELTLVEARVGADKFRGAVWLRRLGPDLRTLRETPLRDHAPEHELLTYEFDIQPDGSSKLGTIGSRTLPADDIVTTWAGGWRGRHFILAARGEEAVLSAWSYGTKVYALGPELAVLWSRQVMPEHSWMTTISPREAIAVDDAGNVAIAFPLDKETVEAYVRHYEQPAVAWSGPFLQTMVTRIAADGTGAASRLFGHEGGDDSFWSAGGVTLRGDEVTLCGSVRVRNKFQEPNHTMEWDLGWARGSIPFVGAGSAIAMHIIDVKRDDLATACASDDRGGIVFAGVNDFLQVDSNSFVEFGQGFLYAVDAEGRETSRRTLRGPRHTEVATFDRAPDGRIYFGGSFDGPITHTPEAEMMAKGMLGVYPVL